MGVDPVGSWSIGSWFGESWSRETWSRGRTAYWNSIVESVEDSEDPWF